MTVMGSRRRSDDAGAFRRESRRLLADSAAWLASLQSVAAEYRRAEAAARADAARETVRLRREARDDARAAAAWVRDQQRARSVLTEQHDRRLLTRALERRDTVRRQAAACCRDARRRAEEAQSARRESIAFADNVARRIGACSKAHVRFMQQEQRESHRQLAAAGIERRLAERRQRDANIARVADERRRVAATQAEADRCAMVSRTELASNNNCFTEPLLTTLHKVVNQR